jgi:hypothetical protein
MNAKYHTNKKGWINIKIYVYSLVRFGLILKKQSKIQSDPTILTQKTLKHIKIFDFLQFLVF